MANATRFTNLAVDGNLEVAGTVKAKGLTQSTYTVTSDAATAAAGDAPTAAEFKKTVDLANELKEKVNKLVSQLITGSDT